MPRCLIALGSNLGDRIEQLRAALHEIDQLSKTRLLARSSWHGTTPVGGPPIGPTGRQELFLNGVVLVDTCMTPDVLHGQLLGIEKSLGRQQAERWASRKLDLDLLLYAGQVYRQVSQQVSRTGASATLEIPHPRMSFRRFVLEPAVEIAGSMLHPTSGWTLAQLLRHLDTAAAYVAVTAPNADDNADASDWLAEQLADALDCPKVELSSPMENVLGGTTDSSAVEFAQAVVSCPAGLEGIKLPCPRPKLLIAWLGGAKNFTNTQGPVARIDTDDRQQALTEALAAVQAVWSGTP